MAVRGDLRPARRWTPAALAGLLLLTGLTGYALSRRSAHTNRLTLAKATAGASARTILALVQAEQAQLAAAGAVLGGRIDLTDATDRAALQALVRTNPDATAGIAPAASDGRIVLRPLLGPLAASAPLDLTSRPEWRLALALARDDGQPRTVGAPGPDGRMILLNVMPMYGAAASPDSVEARRPSLVGYVAALDSPDALAQPSLAASTTDVGAELVQGATVLSSSPGVHPRALMAAPVVVQVNDPALDWSVAAWPKPSHSLLPWYLLVGGALLGLLAAVLAAAGERRSARSLAVAEARAGELRLVARIGPLLQRSLDAGDVLPLFAIELEDELDLTAIAVSRIGPTGEFVRIFTHGATVAVPRWPAELDAPPASVAPGAIVSLALQRGGRAIGVITARSHGGLEPSQVHALRAVTDLLSAALGNARLFQEEQEMVGRLRELDRMKTTFLGSVSHELRTTVTAIKGFANLLAMPGPALEEAERIDYLERIDRNAGSLSVLIDDLLDFARLDRQTLTVVPRAVNLSELVPTIVDQTSPIMADHPLLMNVTPDVVAVADPSAVERIVVNLLSNAAKYSPAGTPVEVALSRLATKAVLEVTDRGPGIPNSERERIFDRFYRVDNPTTRSTRGVGIGLALVLELVGLLAGSVRVSDAPGGGTRFTIELPLVSDGTGPSVRSQLLPT
jgi:signal transduction histidine kinase